MGSSLGNLLLFQPGPLQCTPVGRPSLRARTLGRDGPELGARKGQGCGPWSWCPGQELALGRGGVWGLTGGLPRALPPPQCLSQQPRCPLCSSHWAKAFFSPDLVALQVLTTWAVRNTLPGVQCSAGRLSQAVGHGMGSFDGRRGVLVGERSARD